MRSLLFLLASAALSFGAALSGNKITANGTYTVSTEPGNRYIFSAAGDFGGGSLAVQWVDSSSTATAFGESPATAAETWGFSAPTRTVALVLTGATDPDITVGVALAPGNIINDPEAAFDAISSSFTGVIRMPESGHPVFYTPSADTDAARFTAWKLAHDALQTGETLITPPGDYYVSTNFINLKSATYVFQGSRFYIDGSTAAGGAGAYAHWTFWANELTHLTIQGPWIIDANGVSGKVGMVIQKCLGTNISDIWLKGFTGGTGSLTGTGLYIGGDTSTKAPAKSATNLRVTGSNTGIYIDAGAEYWTLTACHADSNTTGLYNTGGNNQFVGCQLHGNTTNLRLGGSGNAGHGSFVGGSLNHAVTTALKVNSGFPLGFEFVGTQIFASGSGGIDLGGGGVHFTGCEIDTPITCSEAQQGIHIFNGCLMPQTNTVLTSLTAPQRANIKFFGCRTLTGVFASNDPEPPPIYTVATLPAVASATYGTCAVSDATTPAIGSAVVGGGAVKALVTSNGTTWTVTAIP